MIATLWKGRNLKEMIKDASDKKFDIFIVYSFDRLGRSNEVMTEALNLIFATGVTIYVSGMKIENNLLGRLLAGVLGEFAQFDKAMIVLKMKAGLETARKQRGETQGKTPYGYRREGKQDKGRGSKNCKIYI